MTKYDDDAAVVLKGPTTPAKIQAFCGKRLADFKVPKEIHITNAVPRTATGKIQRKRVRAHLLKAQSIETIIWARLPYYQKARLAMVDPGEAAESINHPRDESNEEQPLGSDADGEDSTQACEGAFIEGAID